MREHQAQRELCKSLSLLAIPNARNIKAFLFGGFSCQAPGPAAFQGASLRRLAAFGDCQDKSLGRTLPHEGLHGQTQRVYPWVSKISLSHPGSPALSPRGHQNPQKISVFNENSQPQRIRTWPEVSQSASCVPAW